MALTIVQSDKASAGDRVLAGAYITGEFVAHGTAVVYGAMTACGLVSSACYAALTGASAACSDGNCTNEIELSAKLGQDVWKMNPFARGWTIEGALGRSPQLVSNFPKIDRFENGVATSIKSIDLAAKSYQNLQTLQTTLEGYVMKVANFNGASYGGVTITQNMINGRQLLLAIPPNASAEQLKVIQNVVSWAANQGVTVVTQVVR